MGVDDPITLPNHQETQTGLLVHISKLLSKLLKGPQPFMLPIVVNTANQAQRQGGTNSEGIVKCLHNRTNAPVLVVLYDGLALASMAGVPGASTPYAEALFNATLAAGESRLVYLPFAYELCAIAGAGVVAYGVYR